MHQVLAAPVDNQNYVLLEPLVDNTKSVNSGGFEYFQTVYVTALSLTIALAFVMLVVSGIQYSMAFASASNKSEAIDRIKNALGGLLLALLSVLILRTVNPDLVTPSADLLKLPYLGGAGGGNITPPDGTIPPPGGGLSENDARAQLAAAGIETKPECVGGNTHDCVRLAGIRQQTINEAKAIAAACGCHFFLTGATEGGHSSGHTYGYKFDARPDPALTSYIQTHFTSVGAREGDAAFRDPATQALWVHETANATRAEHWDVDIRG